MKKWLIIFSIIFGIGFIASTAIAGRVYHEELNNYTDHRKERLDISALTNIYIDSEIPVQLETTTEEPYVEFNQTFIDLLGMAPEFELTVKAKGSSTYIDLEQIKSNNIYLGVQKDEASLTVYLPQKAYDTIQVKNQNYMYTNQNSEYAVNLQDVDVEKIELDLIYGEVRLNGNYDQISINIDSGSLDLDSNKPAILEVTGRLNMNLEGQYQNISIAGVRGREVYVDSEVPTHLKMESDGTYIKLRGKYESIHLEGYSNNIDAKSESICNIMVQQSNNTINLNGAFKNIALNGEDSLINIQTTVIPQYIKLLGYITQPINLTLPSNMKGFEVRYVGENSQVVNELSEIMSDYEVVQGVSEKGEITYTYGDGSVPILLDYVSDCIIEIIDGGYSSELQ